jgi:hypothetical protein
MDGGRERGRERRKEGSRKVGGLYRDSVHKLVEIRCDVLALLVDFPREGRRREAARGVLDPRLSHHHKPVRRSPCRGKFLQLTRLQQIAMYLMRILLSTDDWKLQIELKCEIQCQSLVLSVCANVAPGRARWWLLAACTPQRVSSS